MIYVIASLNQRHVKLNSVGYQMKSKHKSKGTFIERDMFESAAYLGLKGFAPQLLILILGKRQFSKPQGRKGKEKRICKNCDSLNVTYTEFLSTYKITQPRMTRAIDQLLAKGFLSRVYPGGTFRQDKAVYFLSTNWIIWRPGTIFETREKEGIARGFCKPKK